MQPYEEQLIALLRGAVRKEPVPFEAADWDRVLPAARAHHLEPLIFNGGLEGLRLMPGPVWDELSRSAARAVFREVQQDHAAQMIRERLMTAEIPHVLLRGAVLKGDYPIPGRVMADLDYLVRVEDYPKIQREMEKLGGRLEHQDGGHFSFLLPSEVLVEFHPNLIYAASPVGTGINPGWQYVRPDSGPYAQELTEEGFYFNLICHLAYHFFKGGTGVRSILDLWVYRNCRKSQPDRAFVERELERTGLLEFARRAEGLAELWFGQGEESPELLAMGEYVLASGTYGTTRQAVLNALCFAGGKGKAFCAKTFYSREEMECRFPWLKGRPWLMPAAWCLRAWRAVTRHGKHIRQWQEAAKQLSDQEIAAQKKRLRQFGLKI